MHNRIGLGRIARLPKYVLNVLGVTLVVLSLALAGNIMAAHAEDATYWGLNSDRSAPQQYTVNLETLDNYYSNPTEGRDVSPETIRRVLAASQAYKDLYDSDPTTFKDTSGTFQWFQGFASAGNIRSFTERQANAYITGFKNRANSAVSAKIDGYLGDLNNTLNTAPEANKPRIQKLIENLTDYKNGTKTVDIEDADFIKNIAASKALAADPSANPDVPGYSEGGSGGGGGSATDPAKEAAKTALQAEVDALKALLDANTASTKNLSDDERAAAQTAYETALAALNAADTKSTEELNTATTEASQAKTTAEGQITANKQTAKGNLDSQITSSKAVLDTDLPEDTKASLQQAINDAQSVSDNPNSTVWQLENAQATLKAKTLQAQKAAKDAKTSAKAALQAQIDALQALLDANGTDTNNLTSQQRSTAEAALQTAKTALADADNKTIKELNDAATAAGEAKTTAEGQIAANKQSAQNDLQSSIDEANTLVTDPNLSAGAQTKLQQAITAAQQVKNSDASTVAQLKDAKVTLDAAIQEAKQEIADAQKNNARANLEAEVQALKALLDANGSDTKNLSDDERALAQAAYDKAKAVLDVADTKSTEELNTATTEASQAKTTAQGQIDANKQTAKANLDSQITSSKAVLDTDLPESTKAELQQAINDAQSVSDNPTSTVWQLENAQAKLKAATLKAQKAAKNAKNTAKAALQAQIDALQALLDANGSDTKNLTDEQRSTAEVALNKAKATLADADNKTIAELNTAADEAGNAKATADTKIAANKKTAKTDLDAKIASAKQAITDDMPASAKSDLQTAIENAEKVSANADASVAQLQKAAQDLEAAKAKATAHTALSDQVQALKALLDANGSDTKNLSDDERAVAQAAYDKAKAVLDVADTKSTEELNTAASEASQAKTTAQGQIDANKQTAKANLDSQITSSKAVLETDLPESTKAELQQAINDAQSVSDNPTSTVWQLENAQAKLKAATLKAQKAAKNAKNTAKARLESLVDQLQSLVDTNTAETKNLSDQERQAAQTALADAKAALADADNKTIAELDKASDATQQAIETANSQIADNKAAVATPLTQAVEELAKLVAENDKVLTENLVANEQLQAEDVLKAAKNLLALAQEGKANVAQLEQSLEAVNAEVANVKEEIAKNRATAIENLDARLNAVKKMLSDNNASSNNFTEAQRNELVALQSEIENTLEQARAEGSTVTVLTMNTLANKSVNIVKTTQQEASKAKSDAKNALQKSIDEARRLLASGTLSPELKAQLENAIKMAEALGTTADMAQIQKALEAFKLPIAKAEAELAATGTSTTPAIAAVALLATGLVLVTRRRKVAKHA